MVCTKDSCRKRGIMALCEYPGAPEGQAPKGQAYASGLLSRSLALARAVDAAKRYVTDRGGEDVDWSVAAAGASAEILLLELGVEVFAAVTEAGRRCGYR